MKNCNSFKTRLYVFIGIIAAFSLMTLYLWQTGTQQHDLVPTILMFATVGVSCYITLFEANPKKSGKC